MKTDQILIFQHLPRTGGTTLQYAIMNRLYRPEETFTMVAGQIAESVDQFRALPNSTKGQFKLIQGHMSFGVHEYLPYPFTYFTMLRHPVDRLISEFFSIAKDPTHPGYEQMQNQGMTFEEFVTKDGRHNCQSKRLHGKKGKHVHGPCTQEMFEIAKDNLERYFSVIGVVERYNESLSVMQNEFEWPDIPFEKLRTNKQNRPEAADIAPSLRTEIEERSALDMELYAYANRHLDEKLGKSKNPDKEIDLNRANTLVTKAVEHLNATESTMALERIEEARTLNTRVRDLAFVHALCLLQMNRLEEARRSLHEELRYFPDNSGAESLLKSLHSD